LLHFSAKKCNLLMINGRLSDNSFNRWLYFPFFAKFLYSHFSLILPTSKDDEYKISQFAPQSKIRFVGNLKYVAQAFDIKAEEKKKMLGLINKRPFWLAASFHPGEDEQIFEAFKSVKKKYPKVLLLAVPRHPERAKSIADTANHMGLKALCMSSLAEGDASKANVLIGDSLNELKLFYTLTDIVFVGGSLIKHGGQNILEPARQKSAIITGPYTHNFKAIVEEFKENEAITTISDAKGLSEAVLNFMAKPKSLNEMCERAYELSKSKGRVLDDILETILKYV
jgi:3-deoxy-D-manno-octulosonic-acid transferase